MICPELTLCSWQYVPIQELTNCCCFMFFMSLHSTCLHTSVYFVLTIVVTKLYTYCCHICHECVFTMHVLLVLRYEMVVWFVCSCMFFFIAFVIVLEKEFQVSLSRWRQFTSSLEASVCRRFSVAIIFTYMVWDW